MRSYFIVNNLKVNPFILQDAPIPGFELLAWEHECSTVGTLWDTGLDAGFSMIGHTQVQGQLWVAEDMTAIKELEEFMGAITGFTEPTKIKVHLHPKDPPMHEELEATVYKLTNIKKDYKIVYDGNWLIKRIGAKYTI